MVVAIAAHPSALLGQSLFGILKKKKDKNTYQYKSNNKLKLLKGRTKYMQNDKHIQHIYTGIIFKTKITFFKDQNMF